MNRKKHNKNIMHGGMAFNLNFMSGLQDMVKDNARNIQSKITTQISNVQQI